MLLDAIGVEKDVDFMLRQLQIQGCFVSKMSGDGARATLHHMLDMLRRLEDRAEFNLSDYVPQAHGSVDALAKLYHALERANIIKDVDPETVEIPEDQ